MTDSHDQLAKEHIQKSPSVADARCDDEDAGSELAGAGATWSPDEEKRLVRKMDWRIFPVLIILFILNFIDR